MASLKDYVGARNEVRGIGRPTGQRTTGAKPSADIFRPKTILPRRLSRSLPRNSSRPGSASVGNRGLAIALGRRVGRDKGRPKSCLLHAQPAPRRRASR
jgi:hypothetical protein